MGYKVLALKWRPQNFDEVIGQEHITQALSNAIKFNRISHAFTFSGPRGVGKTTTARILAQKLNNIDDINSSFDIIEMDAASNRGIDEIRSLRENVSIAPAHGNYKIYIIDEVHMLTKEAFNALLKTLEEPPEQTIFILATTDPHKMPATILSRTQRYDFRRLTINDIKKQLVIILESENKEFEESGLELIARKADGSMRDALGYLDQVMNYCDNIVDLKSVQKALGVIGDEAYLDIFDNVYKSNVGEVLSAVNSVIMDGVSVYDFIAGFNAFLRKLLHNMIGYDDSDEFINRWLSDNPKINQIDVIRIMEIIFQFELKIKLLDHSDLALELLMVKLCKLDSFSDITNLIQDLDCNDNKPKKIENDSSADKSNSIELKNDLKSENIEEKPKNKISSGNSTNEVDSLNSDDTNKSILDINIINNKLTDIINYIEDKNSKIAALLGDVEIMDITDMEIHLKVNNMSGFIYETLSNGIDLIKNAFNIILKTKHNIIIIKGSKLESEISNNNSNAKDEEHPLFMDVLDKFGGEILR